MKRSTFLAAAFAPILAMMGGNLSASLTHGIGVTRSNWTIGACEHVVPDTPARGHKYGLSLKAIDGSRHVFPVSKNEYTKVGEEWRSDYYSNLSAPERDVVENIRIMKLSRRCLWQKVVDGTNYYSQQYQNTGGIMRVLYG